MFGNVSKCSTASEMWNVLQTRFVSESKIRIMKLKIPLQTLKKGT